MPFLILNRRRLDKLSDIASDIGLIALVSIVLPAVLDRFDLLRVLLGTVAAITFWLLSVWLRR